MDTQLKKGVLELCVLHQLTLRDMYGYELMKIIQEAFPDVYDGSIYTILRRLRSEQYTETYLKDIPSGGPARKYYRVTELGRDYAARSVAEWRELSDNVNRLLG